MTISTVKGVLAAAVATGGTFTVGYPSGKDRGAFQAGVYFRLAAIGKLFSAPEDIIVALGAAVATITYNGATTLPSGASFVFQFDDTGTLNPVVEPVSGQTIFAPVRLGIINLGSPGVGVANGFLLSAAITALAGVSVFTGALGPNGTAVADARTGRNVVAAWTGTAVMTITGTDMYGKKLVEASASGTTFTGKKAFKTITSVSVNADVTAATIGTGNVLGLPIYTGNAAYILKECQDNAVATAGTITIGLSLGTKPTATTADNRGTYAPNATPDSLKSFTLLAAIQDDAFLGAAQFAG